MKNRFSLWLIVILVAVFLVGCVQDQRPYISLAAPTLSVLPAEETTLVQTALPSATRRLQPGSPSPQLTLTPTTTSTPQPSHTPTRTPFPTPLPPEEQERRIGIMLRTNGGCLSPCFWGIVPNQTTLAEAREKMQTLGYKIYTYDKEQYDLDFRSIIGLQGGATFTVKNEKVVGIRAFMSIDGKRTPRSDWAAFTPEVLFKTYGIPSEIRFLLSYNRDNQPPGQDIKYRMDMFQYYENLNLIIVYNDEPTDLMTDSYHYCPAPLSSLGVGISMWVGKDAFYPPAHWGALMEDATTLSYQEFYQLVTENPGTACINLKAEAFKGQ